MDLRSRLAQLESKLGQWRAAPEASRSYGAPAHRRAGNDATALMHLRDHDDVLSNDAQLELAALYARSGHWQDAVDMWEQLGDRGVMEAMERLAKYHEHRGDFAAAQVRNATLTAQPGP